MSAESEVAPAAASRFGNLIEKLRRVCVVLPGVDRMLRQEDFEGAWRLLRGKADCTPDNGLMQYGLAVIL